MCRERSASQLQWILNTLALARTLSWECVPQQSPDVVSDRSLREVKFRAYLPGALTLRE
jgi:hypothetical protein